MVTRFIPPYLGEDVKSYAERKVFDILHNLSMPNAVVLHSLGLPRHNSKIYGEIDFVIVCEHGIACLEIKGGSVSCHNGVWSFMNRYGEVNNKPQGPFEQVTGAMFSLRTRIRNQFASNQKIKNAVFACGVMFPDIEFKSKGQSIIPEIVFDLRNEENEVGNYIKDVFLYWRTRNPREDESNAIKLSKYDIDRIAEFLRGDFGYIQSLNEYVDAISRRLWRLTEEQYCILAALSENERLMIEGPAGTGKTLLAVEYANRQVMAENRTLLLVYNKNLSKHLKDCESEMLKIEHFHGLIANYLPITNDTNHYFDQELPEIFFHHVSSGGVAKYDVIVIDEAQDLLKPVFLMCIDELLKGGIEKGRWCLFYDRNQNIYNSEFNEGVDYLSCINAVKWTLQYNCRNTKPIGLTNSLLTHFPAARVIREDGDNVEYIIYTSEQEFADLLGKLIRKFKLNKFNLNNIVLLSPCSYEKSVISRSKALENVCEVSTELKNANKDALFFSTIQGFKGLESNIVILVDLDKFHEREFDNLLYTAISRAKVNLFMFCTVEVKKTLDLRYIEGVKLGIHNI